MHLGVAGVEVVEHPVRGFKRNLRHDATHGLNQVKANIFKRNARIETQQVGCERTHLGDGLDAGETATDNHEGEQAIARRALWQVRCDVEVLVNAVTHVHRFFDGLHSDCDIGNTRNREGSRNGTGGHHDVVILPLVSRSTDYLDGCQFLGVVNLDYFSGDDVGLVQVAAK